MERGASRSGSRAAPAARDLIWRTPLGTVEARLRGDRAEPGGPVRFAFAQADGAGARAVSSRLAPPARPGGPDRDEALPCLRLPDEPTRQLGERLVGLEAARRDVLLQWRCRWDGALVGWSRKTGSPIPVALQEQLRTGHALWVLHGDPGTGKSALARALSHDYCQLQGIPGSVLSLTTGVRGQGTVGDFSRRLRAAFGQLTALPETELKVLLVDEADALAMPRSEAQSHQEDKAATSTLIQALDETAGIRRLAIIMTSNSVARIDAAVQRRARLIAFERPDLAARRTLLARWLPQLTARELDGAAAASDAMTPADIDRAMGEVWLAAVGTDVALRPASALLALQQAARTGSV